MREDSLLFPKNRRAVHFSGGFLGRVIRYSARGDPRAAHLQSAAMKATTKMPSRGASYLIALFFCAAANSLAAADAPARPNFVFIYTDDQRWDALGVVQREQGDAARFPWLATPHLDRLASEGIRFRNAFV